MRDWLVEYLICPACPGESALRLAAAVRDGDEIVEGELICPACAALYAVRDGVPRFVPAGDDYCGNFGFQWTRWRDIQIDRLGGHKISETRFFADSGWDPAWLGGKVILDAGCGAGRFADVVAAAGARVIACDISAAVSACRETTAVWDGRVQVVQASLFDLPLRRGVFDGVFCMGVIQHTPDPERLVLILPAFLKPGGQLALNFYEDDFWPKLQWIKYALRLITPYLPTATTYSLSRGLVRLLFPLTAWLARFPVLRALNLIVPICAVHHPALSSEQRRTWTLLDTFDWYAPRYEKRQKHGRVARLVAETGIGEIFSRRGIVRGRKKKRA